ncbi:alkyl hydroperoxide reductase [Sphingomonas sp. Leaf357]|uniref:peroxiredoxin n=1 Tax=Sphingomonas sp. Leaf357 TaxID=1736350 RepID=UPI0006F9CD20|nr:peroxiredoxin [Sphingomonas sp. Leaf357]KQS01934.1 alkyl hydroperoxide reductase [Sphingomonas sp. Leaf357]
MSVELGDTSPDVALTRPGGEKVDLRAYLGKPLVLYFYPKDDTTGCTREAQDFGALYPEFQALGVEVLGVSKDTPAKHTKFIAKYDLKVPLASDEDGSVTEAFGVWIEKKLYGKAYLGIDRSTWLFDAAGVLQRVWRKVKVPGHAMAVLAAAKELT